MKFSPLRLIYSLSSKLVIIFFITATSVAGLLWLTLDISFERQFSDSIQPYFSKYLISLQKEIGFPPDVNIAKEITQHAPVDIVIEAPTYRWSSNGDFIEKPYLDVKLQSQINKDVKSEAGFYKGNFILRTFRDGHTISFIINEKLNKLPKSKDIMIIIFVALLIIIILFWSIHKLFSPVGEIQKGLNRIGNGEVAYRLDINRSDELGELANTINKMANNIEQMLEAKRQLLLAISHELRTPITRAKIALSLLDENENVESITEDIDEMEALIQELLESERLRENHSPLEFEMTDINDIIYQVQGRFFADSPVILELESNLPILCIDPSRIGLAIKNIIKNAITASHKNGNVIVRTSKYDDDIVVCVEDFGIGIEKEVIPHLTEPFYRADSSRQRSTGGVGIGLFLIKAIIDAHDGELIIDSEINKGTTVTMKIPIKQLSEIETIS